MSETSPPRDEAGLRRWVERRKGAILDEHWAYATEDGFVGEYLDNEYLEDVDPLLSAIDRYRARWAKARRTVRPTEIRERPVSNVGAREEALRELLGRERSRGVQVQAFRRRHLKAGPLEPVRLLEPAEIEDWIEERSEAPSRWASVAVPEPGEALEVERPLPGQGHRYLVFDAPQDPSRPEGSWRARMVPTTSGGPLEELRELAHGISDHDPWSEPETATWLLTGRVPRMSEVTALTRTSLPSAMSRIVLTIDPTVTPAELAKHYREVRNRLWSQKPRDLGEKSIELAAFAGRRPDELWRDSMSSWNEEHPEWAYTDYRRFFRDATQALKRLRDPGHSLRAGEARPVARGSRSQR